MYTIVGDHEIGDNDWGANKRPLIPTYKEVYVDKGRQRGDRRRAAPTSTPPPGLKAAPTPSSAATCCWSGSISSKRSIPPAQFTQTASQIASVQIDVTGTQLAWLDNTLTLADNDPTIDHVIVMAHAPIAGQDAVIVGHSSGLKNVTGEDGPLWQTLAAHDVDLYLPGEVHDISMQLADDVLQVVTGTNIFQPTRSAGVNNIGFNLTSPATSEQNYMVVEVYEDRIDLTIKQIETKIWGSQGLANDPVNDDPYKNREARVAIATANAGFQIVGTLTIDKSSGSARVPQSQRPVSLGMDLRRAGQHRPQRRRRDRRVRRPPVSRRLAHRSERTDSRRRRFALGDVNGDGRNDFVDFRLFKTAYDVNNGIGAFASATAVPEPAVSAFWLLATVWAGARRLHRNPLQRGCVSCTP